MNAIIEQTKQKIMRIKDNATERSYYPILCDFFQEFAKSDIIKLRDVHATPEETTTQYEKKVGFPDITIRNKNELIGWIEVKTPEENLAADKFHNQFTKYRESLENIIFTNLREWQLWQWVDGESKQVGKTIFFDLTEANGASEEDIEQLLIRFFEGRAYQTRTPKQLALALAKKTRLLSKQVEEAIETGDERSDLWELKETFQKTLIQDISPHQFANMVAETMAYSLFLSALEHERRGNGSVLTLTNAIDYLPTNVPVLVDLYGLIKKVASSIPNIYESAQLLIDQLNASEIRRIHEKLIEHKPGEDPVIQFYEPFLAEYDPKEREARGVYYTPKPVVDYIVRSVDWILRNKFEKEKGLADESVNLLDPATGTGTFLMSAIQEIYWKTKKQNEALGDEMVSREFNKIVLSHILKHFYGFELLIAPYAIAHLKLTLEIERLGFDFNLTRGDGDPDNDRFKVYLANTLDDPNKPPQTLMPGYNSIPEESTKAQEVKRDAPILAIIGNPPYSNFGRMNRGEWILGLLKDYKQGLGERKINLDDDFIKFIRFAQWKLEKAGQGIFAMITSNTFIDGMTHRQMRRSLMDTFDEIYIYNLHGNSRKGEVAPGGSKDENVFNIQQGVSINIFIKLPQKEGECVVNYCDLWGLREHKYATLLDEDLNETKWEEVEPKDPKWFFAARDRAGEIEYENYPSILNVFDIHNSGMQTKRDNLTIHYSKNELQASINDIKKLSSEEVRVKYDLPADGRDWTVEGAKKDILAGYQEINVQYRPFDTRKTIFTGKSKGYIAYPRADVMRNMIVNKNLGLVMMKQVVLEGNYTHFGVSNSPIDERTFKSNRGGTYLLPLYAYNESSQVSMLADKECHANISAVIYKTLAKNLSLQYIFNGRGNLENDFGPEDIFYYAYAVFHSSTYRSRYAEQLKIDFPRLPITSDKELFKRLVALGNELVNLHLLGENPFDSTKTILDEPNRWGVKIGGKVPANLQEWKVTDIRYDLKEKRVYINAGQYFEGIESEVWDFTIGGYQVCEKWLKDRKKAERILSTEDLKHYMKIVVVLRETIHVMSEVDKAILSWPMK